MHIIVTTKTARTKRKILNFQIAGNEILVNYKIGHTTTVKSSGPTVTETYKAVVQSDIIKLSSAQKIEVVRGDEELYSYEKIAGEEK